MKKNIVIFYLAGLFLFGGVLALFYTGILKMNNPDKKRFPVRGIDISHYQETIDWSALKNEDVRFVFIKATEGGDFKDARFAENWQNAKQAGLVRGAYHFFTFCRAGKDQAQNFLSVVPVEPGTLPPVIDLEFGGNCRTRPEKSVLVKDLNDFIAETERVYGQKPIFYVTYDAYRAYLQGEFNESRLWVRDRFFYPELPDKRSWAFWQYSNRGRLDGISTYVDLNVFNGTEEEFRQLIR